MAGHHHQKLVLLDHPPQHVAIICDGNRRWAKKHGMSALLGHRKAIEDVFEPLVNRAADHGVKYLTFWVFSTENWSREHNEVEGLFGLFREFFGRQLDKIIEKGARVKAIGDISQLPPDVQEKIALAIKKSVNNSGITLVFAVNYGGRDELTRAVRHLARDVKAGKIDPSNGAVCPELIKTYLDTADIPDPDLIIRTSGEQRLSGFMPWQSQYAEFAFPKFYFPEFTPERLDQLLLDFDNRERRFGGN